ncbi:hypothetical protein AVEN_44294-1, partial [Araneus ventricosus]
MAARCTRCYCGRRGTIRLANNAAVFIVWPVDDAIHQSFRTSRAQTSAEGLLLLSKVSSNNRKTNELVTGARARAC